MECKIVGLPLVYDKWPSLLLNRSHFDKMTSFLCWFLEIVHVTILIRYWSIVLSAINWSWRLFEMDDKSTVWQEIFRSWMVWPQIDFIYNYFTADMIFRILVVKMKNCLREATRSSLSLVNYLRFITHKLHLFYCYFFVWHQTIPTSHGNIEKQFQRR